MSCRCGDTCVLVPTCDEEADFLCDIGQHAPGPLREDADGLWRECLHCGDSWDEYDDDWDDE